MQIVKEYEYIRKDTAVKLLENELEALEEMLQSEDYSDSTRQRMEARAIQCRNDLLVIQRLPTHKLI